MSDSKQKAYDNHIFWDNQEPFKKIGNTLTELQALNIVNQMYLRLDKEDKEDIEENYWDLKNYIKKNK